MSVQKRGVSGRAAIADFISPDDGARGKLQRKGIQPKNHMRDNLRLLRDTEFKNREAKELAAEEPRELYKLPQFRNVESRLHEPTTATESAAIHVDDVDGGSYLVRGKAEQDRMQLRKGNLVKKYQLEDELQDARARAIQPVVERPVVPRAEDALPKARRQSKDFIVENRTKIQDVLPPRVNDGADKGLIHEEFGRVPKYLVDRKIKAAQEEAEIRRNAPDPDCPRGMKRMPEDERLNTLDILSSSKEECLRQLSKLPFVIDTPMLKKKQDTLEQKLREIDNALELFRKPKVFIAIDS